MGCRRKPSLFKPDGVMTTPKSPEVGFSATGLCAFSSRLNESELNCKDGGNRNRIGHDASTNKAGCNAGSNSVNSSGSAVAAFLYGWVVQQDSQPRAKCACWSFDGDCDYFNSRNRQSLAGGSLSEVSVHPVLASYP
jgi:hypothetical protein